MATTISAGADKLQLLQAFADAGFRVIPIRTYGEGMGKAPALQDWQHSPFVATPDPKNFPGNYGIALDDNTLVIDIDPRNYRAGVSSWEALLKECGVSPLVFKDTLVVRTGGGGFHIYLRKPEDFKVYHQRREYPGIEFKTRGRQVVGPGSIHPDTGKRYEVATQSPAVIMPAPQALLDRFKETTEIVSTGKPLPGVAESDTRQMVERFTEYLVQLDEIPEGSRNDTCYIIAARAKEDGLSEQTAFRLITEKVKFSTPFDEQEIRAAVNSCYRSKKVKAHINNAQAVFTKLPKRANKEHMRWDMKQSKEGKRALATQNNLRNYLSLDELGLTGLFCFNELTYRVELARPAPWPPFQRREMQDTDYGELKIYLSHACRVEYSIPDLVIGVTSVAQRQSYHPVRSWLDPLVWDGTPRLDTWLPRMTGCDDTPYSRAVSSIVLMASVARSYQPGCKFDYMMVLEGPQGRKKSQLVEAMAGFDMNLYTSAPLRLENTSAEKDTIAVMATAQFVEIAELAHSTQEDIDALKGFITRRVDKVRLPFTRLPVNLPRQCVLVGTYNPEAGVGYLKDRTGARRFWPIRVKRDCDLMAFELERDQLFAEAKVRWQAGGLLYMPPEVEAIANIEQKERSQIDPWQDLLECVATKDKVWTVEEIARDLLRLNMRDVGTRENRRIAACMSNLGFEHGRFVSPEGHRRRGFKHYTLKETALTDAAVADIDKKLLDNITE
jgi:predicted P-loop ATPase